MPPTYIDDPKHPIPSPNYNAEYVNNLGLKVNSPNVNLYQEAQQNYMNSNYNYSNDLTISDGLLKYLNKYQGKDKHINLIYGEKQIDVNKYYIQKYQSESYIFKLIIFFCGLALVGCLFFLKGLISETLYIIYLGIIISIGFITIGYTIYNLLFRDNVRFDEYDYGDMSNIGTDIFENDTNISRVDISNTVYDSENKCV
jgi:hypothetical protein